jgi:hypothetical protein
LKIKTKNNKKNRKEKATVYHRKRFGDSQQLQGMGMN